MVLIYFLWQVTIRDGTEYQIIRLFIPEGQSRLLTVTFFSNSNKPELTDGTNVGHLEGHYPTYNMVACQRK